MFIAAFYVISKILKTTQMPSTGEWFNKLWYIHIMDYYSATKRSKLFIHATTWMKHKIIRLSERKQTKEYMLYNSSYIKF